jgi:hypothetical protein
MEKLAFTRANLADVRLIMAIMCIPAEELLCPFMSDIKCHYFSRTSSGGFTWY